jgi:GntR family transcriptional regulator
MLRRPSLSDSVLQVLKDRLRGLPDGSQGRLPSELALVRELGVSRQTVREAMRTLEGEGLISRRQGVGSFITPGGRIEAAGEHLEGFVETIRRSGAAAGAKLLTLKEVALPADAVRALRVPRASRGFIAETLYLADAAPAVFSIVYVPRAHVGSLEVLQGRRRWTSMREFFQAELHVSARYATLSLSAEAAGPRVAGLLGLAPGAPVLVTEGVTCAGGDEPILYTRAWFRTDRYRLTVIRR